MGLVRSGRLAAEQGLVEHHLPRLADDRQIQAVHRGQSGPFRRFGCDVRCGERGQVRNVVPRRVRDDVAAGGVNRKLGGIHRNAVDSLRESHVPGLRDARQVGKQFVVGDPAEVELLHGVPKPVEVLEPLQEIESVQDGVVG